MSDEITPAAPEPTPPPAAEPATTDPAPEQIGRFDKDEPGGHPLEPQPEPEAEAEPTDEAFEVDLDELDARLEKIISKGIDQGIQKHLAPEVPEEEPEPEPEPGSDEARIRALERAELDRQAAAAKQAEADAEKQTLAEIAQTMSKYKLTKEETMAVAKAIDANPTKHAELTFEESAILTNPALAGRLVKPTPPTTGTPRPQGGPNAALLVEVGSGGEQPPKDFEPGPGHGFGDINRWARQSGEAAKLVTRS